MKDAPRSTPSGQHRPMFRRLLRPILLLGLVLLLLLMAGVAWIAAHFNPQTQAQQLTALVRLHAGRELMLSESPRLTFTPSLGLALGPLSLSTPAGVDTPARRIATAQHIHLSLDPLALLRGQTQIRRVQIDGLTLWSSSAPSGQRYVLPSVDLSLSPVQEEPVAAVDPSPAPADAPASMARADTAAPRFTRDVDLQATVLDSANQTLPLRLQGRISVEAGPQDAHESSPLLGSAFHAVLQGAFDQTTIALDVTRNSTSPVLRFDLALGTLDLDRYRSQPLAQSVVRTSAVDTANLAPQPSQSSPLVASDSSASPAVLMAALQDAKAPPLRWLRDLGLHELDAQGTLRVTALKFMNVQLAHLRLQAQMREIQVRESQGRKRRRIELAPLTASLYGGGVHGSLRINLDGDEPASPYPTYLAAKLDLRGVQVGTLLRDALDVRWLEGRGNVALDLRSGGGTLDALKRQLTGTVGVQLQDGALAMDLTGALRESLGQLRKKAAPRSSSASTSTANPSGDPARWRTTFDQLRASFQIDEGVARNQDLSIQSSSLRVGGSGTAWVAEERLDYTLRVTVAPSVLQGEKSSSEPDLEKLHGLTVPVRLQGPFENIQWRIAYADIAPTKQLRNALKGWAQDSLNTLQRLTPQEKAKE